jgi:hypothetical protein
MVTLILKSQYRLGRRRMLTSLSISKKWEIYRIFSKTILIRVGRPLSLHLLTMMVGEIGKLLCRRVNLLLTINLRWLTIWLMWFSLMLQVSCNILISHRKVTVVWTSLGPLPQWVPGPTTW